MKRHLTAIIALVLFSAGAISIATAAPEDPIVTAVTKANDEVQLATKDYDTKTMDRALTKDFILVLNRGMIVDRAAWLTGVGDRTTVWEENKTESLTIHHYNNDCALAIGILHLRYRENKKLTDVKLRFIDVWVKQNGQWKWASSQVAHLPPAKH
ncbi:MAG: nuclear transport factor 2 family protein [Candidatus Eremiobacteraeota bacterium]|nr:nuclear transport factor 2 family protein [Candidatus Eremiobacteraeota bacterium]